MKHKFLVVLDGDMTRKQAQEFLHDIGRWQGASPPKECIRFTVVAYPLPSKPTLILERS